MTAQTAGFQPLWIRAIDMAAIKTHNISGITIKEYEKSLVIGGGACIQTPNKEQALAALAVLIGKAQELNCAQAAEEARLAMIKRLGLDRRIDRP